MSTACSTIDPAASPAPLYLDLLAQQVKIEACNPSWLEVLAYSFEESVIAARRSHSKLCIECRPAWRTSKFSSWDLRMKPAGALKSLPRTPAALVSALTLWATQSTDRHYVFHAGALVRNRVGVLLPAASFQGKSTLTAGLVRRGFELLSDEVGAIDLASGTLVGYPRALSLRRDVLALLGLDPTAGISLGDTGTGTRMVRAADLGGVRAKDGVELGLVVLPRFATASATRWERLRPGPAAISLLESSCSQQRLKEAGLDFVLDLAKRLPCYRLTYSDLDESVAAVCELVAKVGGQ